MNRIARGLTICLLSTTTMACSDYQFQLNDRVLYTPPPLFTGYKIADPALHGCVAQTIADRKITEASQLKRLGCTNAGIKTLVGIEVFTSLEAVDLDHNAISDIAPLAALGKLTELHLASNNVRSVSALAVLEHLNTLNLAGNPHLSCTTATSLTTASKPTLPKYCKLPSGTSAGD